MVKQGTFLVTHADDDSAVLKDTADGQVHTLATNPSLDASAGSVGDESADEEALAAGDAIEATIAPEPPLEVAWELREVESRRSLTVRRSSEPPTTQEREVGRPHQGRLVVEDVRDRVLDLPRWYGEHVDLADPRSLTTGEIAAEQDEGDLTRRERAGVGEIHVLTVPPGEAENAVADVLDDEATLVRAADLGVKRVEVRSDDESVVSVRYMP